MNRAHTSLQNDMLAALEEDLKQAVSRLSSPAYSEMHQMITYHMGWTDAPHTSGKRIRPLLTLLSCASSGRPWRTALPAASAIELLHNFSLVHDDIEDQSEMRRGRATVWKKWGVHQAINIGDALFTLAHLTMYRLENNDASRGSTLETLKRFDEACMRLTQGQYLDMSFETRSDVTTAEYLEMIEGKTAALLSTATAIGALIGKASQTSVERYHTFGHHLGMAFQILDDVLGIWGEPSRTGKQIGDDIRARKKTLPILFGMERSPAFAELWTDATSDADRTSALIDALDETGAQEYAHSLAGEHTHKALGALEAETPSGVAGEALQSLAHRLLARDA